LKLKSLQEAAHISLQSFAPFIGGRKPMHLLFKISISKKRGGREREREREMLLALKSQVTT